MPRIRIALPLVLTAGLVATLVASTPSARPEDPEPKVVTPGSWDLSKPCMPPSDAVVLFDGADLSLWESAGGGPAPWTVSEGYATVNGKGSIVSKRTFGDAQIHVEFATPYEVHGESQERG